MAARVLWLEDEALSTYSDFLAAILVDGRYEFDLAVDASQCAVLLEKNSYDAIIIDIQVPPGKTRYWIDRHFEAGRQGTVPRLGLELVQAALAGDLPLCGDGRLSPKTVGVLTVERPEFFESVLRPLGVNIYAQKTIHADDDILLSIIDRVLRQK